jgi:ABC-type glycerol-3-phosphate transport system substrate-binding protein
MTWPEFMGEVSELDYTQDIAFGRMDLEIFMDRFTSRSPYFIDEAGNTQNLYSEEMVSLLEECREWSDMGLCAAYSNPATLTEMASFGGGLHPDYLADMFCTLPEEYTSTRQDIIYFAPMLFDGDAVSIDGNVRYPEINWATLYGVNAGSPMAGEAQDFLLFLLSEEAQMRMAETNPMNGLPFNRAAFRHVIEKDLERVQATMPNILDLDFPTLVKEAEETVEQIAYFIIQKPYYRTIIREVAKEFFLDQISAEAAARQMSDKVSLYLKEQP